MPNIQVNLRMILYKLIVTIIRKQLAPTVQTRNVKAKMAVRRNTPSILVGKMPEPVNLIQNAPGTASKFSPLRSGDDFTPHAIDQFDAQFGFKFFNCERDGLRRYMKRRGCPANTTQPYNGIEVLQLRQVHQTILNSISRR